MPNYGADCCAKPVLSDYASRGVSFVLGGNVNFSSQRTSFSRDIKGLCAKLMRLDEPRDGAVAAASQIGRCLETRLESC